MRPSFLLTKTETGSLRRSASFRVSAAVSLAATASFQTCTAAKAAGDLAASRVRASSSAARARTSSDWAAVLAAAVAAAAASGCRRGAVLGRRRSSVLGRRRRGLELGDLCFGGLHIGGGLRHVVGGLARFGAGSLRSFKRLLRGLVGGSLVGLRALLERRGVGHRI